MPARAPRAAVSFDTGRFHQYRLAVIDMPRRRDDHPEKSFELVNECCLIVEASEIEEQPIVFNTTDHRNG